MKLSFPLTPPVLDIIISNTWEKRIRQRNTSEYQCRIFHIRDGGITSSLPTNPVDITTFLPNWENLKVLSVQLVKDDPLHRSINGVYSSLGYCIIPKWKHYMASHQSIYAHLWVLAHPWATEHKIPLNVGSFLKKHQFTVPFWVINLRNFWFLLLQVKNCRL